MARNGGGASGNHRGRLWLSFLNLMFMVGGTLFWDPLLTIAQRNPHKPSLFLPIYAYIYLLIPINFHLHILLLFLDYATITHAGNPEGSRPVFLKKRIPQAAHTISFATLMLSAPLFIRAAVSEESIGFAVAAALVCLASITVLASVIKKLIKSVGLARALFALCISAGFLISYTINDDVLPNFILGHLPLLSFVAFTISMALVILRIGAPSPSRAKDFATTALSVAIAALLVGGYLKVYVCGSD